MSVFDEKFDHFRRKARRELSHIRKLNRTCTVLATVFLPFFISTVFSYRAEIISVSEPLYWSLLMFLCLFQSIFVVFILGDVVGNSSAFMDVHDLREVHDEICDDNDIIMDQIEIIFTMYLCLRVSVSMVHEYIVDNFIDASGLNARIEEMMSPIVHNCNEIFEFDGGEFWSFAVYLHDKNDNYLKSVWRNCAKNHPSKGMGRDWPVGSGNVGITFQKQKKTITKNSSAGDGAALTEVSDQLSRDYDSDVYVSYASYPIMSNDAEAAPLGVLIAASDFEGRFDENNCHVLEAASAMLGMLVQLGGQNCFDGLDDLVQSA